MVEFFLGVIKMSARLVFTGNRLKVKIIFNDVQFPSKHSFLEFPIKIQPFDSQ